MNIDEYMKKHNLTDDDIDAIAAPYETGVYETARGTIYSGSHLDAVGKRRVTVVYDASKTQRVASLAKAQGVKPSEIYRDALDYYLAAQS